MGAKRRLASPESGTDDNLDAFPCEDDGWPEEGQKDDGWPEESQKDGGRPEEGHNAGGTFDYADLDVLDRARADDSAPALTLTAAHPPYGRAGVAHWVVGAVSLIAAVGWGAFAYEKSRPFPATYAGETPAAVSRDAGPATAPPTGEAVAAPSTPDVASPPAPVTPAAGPLEEASPAPADRVARHEDAVRPAVSSTERAAVSGTSLAAPAVSSPAPEAAPSINVPSLAGAWTLTRDVESSSYNAFTGMRFGYQLELQHQGGRITGSGRKVSENGEPIAPEAQTRIRVEGTIAGDRMRLTFSEGVGKEIRGGTFLLAIEDPGLLRGRFSSNAANSRGTVEVRRQ